MIRVAQLHMPFIALVALFFSVLSVSGVALAVPSDNTDIDEQGRTSLMRAVINQIPQSRVDTLLRHADTGINAADTDGQTALMHAVLSGSNKALRALVSTHTLDVNAVDNKGWTALMYAVHAGAITKIHILLEAADIDINIRDMYKKNVLRNPVSASARTSPEILAQVEIAKLLIWHQAKSCKKLLAN